MFTFIHFVRLTRFLKFIFSFYYIDAENWLLFKRQLLDDPKLRSYSVTSWNILIIFHKQMYTDSF